MSKATDAAIRSLIENLQSDSDERRLADEFGALPVYSDWTTTLLLTPDRKIVVYDAESKTAKETTAHDLVTLALVAASERYVELSALRPQRPADAIVCSICSGNGRVGTKDGPRCGKCKGLGWTTKS